MWTLLFADHGSLCLDTDNLASRLSLAPDTRCSGASDSESAAAGTVLTSGPAHPHCLSPNNGLQSKVIRKIKHGWCPSTSFGRLVLRRLRPRTDSPRLPSEAPGPVLILLVRRLWGAARAFPCVQAGRVDRLLRRLFTACEATSALSDSEALRRVDPMSLL